MSHLLLYIPVTLAILVVLETTKQEDPKLIMKRSLRNFGILTGVLLVGSLLVFAIQTIL